MWFAVSVSVSTSVGIIVLGLLSGSFNSTQLLQYLSALFIDRSNRHLFIFFPSVAHCMHHVRRGCGEEG